MFVTLGYCHWCFSAHTVQNKPMIGPQPILSMTEREHFAHRMCLLQLPKYLLIFCVLGNGKRSIDSRTQIDLQLFCRSFIQLLLSQQCPQKKNSLMAPRFQELSIDCHRLSAQYHGPSIIQNYDSIIRNKPLWSRLSIIWRVVLNLMLALSAAYKAFAGGESILKVDVMEYISNKSYYCMYSPPGLELLGFRTGISIFFNATLPFLVASSLIFRDVSTTPWFQHPLDRQ